MEATPDNSAEQNPAQTEETVQSGLVDFADPVSSADNVQATPENVQKAVEAKLAKKAARDAAKAAKAEAEAAKAPVDEPSPEASADTRTAAQKADDAAAAARHEAAKQFTERVLAARKPENTEPRPQPVAPGIVNQTRAEMEAGQKMNEHHANLKLNAPQRKRIDATEGKNTPVFRPNDYVPDQKKGQGNVGARPV